MEGRKSVEVANMDKVSVEIDSKWVKVVRSPLYFIIVSLQGVSVTFAPLFLYYSGRNYFNGFEWVERLS